MISGSKLHLKKLLIYAVLALITGCANSTYQKVFANRNYRIVEQRAHFKHFVVEYFPNNAGDTLHIYIEGDGNPWLGNAPAADPTPRQPLALELMYGSAADAIYLGRPCYFNHYARGEDAQCDVRYWTSARYSQAVIDDMTAVALRYIAQKNPRRIVLIGYSGGGVLATMMACALPKPVTLITLITLAANLDTDRWAALHNYSALSLSRNPAEYFVPCSGLTQLHFAGADDMQVPPDITQTFTDRFDATLTVLPNTDHSRGWVEQWPQLLAWAIAQ